MSRDMTMDVDLNNMPTSVSQRLHNLIEESNFFEIPTINDLRAKPDEYTYTITVVAGNALHTVHVSDSSMPKNIRPLVEELTELARATT